MNINDRIKTPHGYGTIIGFERFKPNGEIDAPSKKDDGKGRILIKLDEENTWCFKNSIYALFRDQI